MGSPRPCPLNCGTDPLGSWSLEALGSAVTQGALCPFTPWASEPQETTLHPLNPETVGNHPLDPETVELWKHQTLESPG